MDKKVKNINAGFVTPNLSDEQLKNFFSKNGIAVQDKRDKPFGNTPCTCGSEIRYDLCCGAEDNVI